MFRISALLLVVLATSACNSDAGSSDGTNLTDALTQADTDRGTEDGTTLPDTGTSDTDDAVQPDITDDTAESDTTDDVVQSDTTDDITDDTADSDIQDDPAPDSGDVTADTPDADVEPTFPTVELRATIDGTDPLLAAQLDRGDRFARSIALLDGSPEGGGVLLAIGTRSDDDGATDAGAVYILALSETGEVEVAAKISATQGGLGAGVLRPDGEPLFFGYGTAGIGDLDGDGIEDLGVTAPLDVGGGSYYSITLNADHSVKSATRTAGVPGDALAFLGDIVGDARPEIAVAAATAAVAGATSAGSVQLHSLNADGTLSLVATWDAAASPALAGIAAGDNFGGRTIVPIGDLDGDGQSEVAVGAFRADDGRGALWILFLGETGEVLRATEIADGVGGLPTHLAVDDNFGHAAVGVGDLDGNGVPDVLTAANRADGDRGALYVLLLESDGSVRAHQRIAAEDVPEFAIAEGERFGRSMAVVGTFSGQSLWVAIGGGARTTGNFRLLEVAP